MSYRAYNDLGELVCVACGAVSSGEDATSIVCPACAIQREDGPTRPVEDFWRPIPIGDLVEKGLTAIGITKERVEKLTRTEGKPGGCGCAGRKKWLNEVGNKVQIDARNALIAAKRFYVGD
jgi:hypothetical protein